MEWLRGEKARGRKEKEYSDKMYVNKEYIKIIIKLNGLVDKAVQPL